MRTDKGKRKKDGKRTETEWKKERSGDCRGNGMKSNLYIYNLHKMYVIVQVSQEGH